MGHSYAPFDLRDLLPPREQILPLRATQADAAPSPSGLPTTHVPSQVAAADDIDAQTQRILNMLESVVDPNHDPDAALKTTLEFRGQWQPKPNGAATGHGVVPKDWAIDLASENERSLASFGWAGGAQLCLSNAFHEIRLMEAQAQDLIDSGLCAEDDAPVQCILTLARAAEEREALMRRQWSDIDFQQGEGANQEVLRHLERDFASQLASTAARQLRKEDARGRTNGAEGKSAIAPWYNIRVAGGTHPGNIFLSAKLNGEGVDLNGHDDESGRQRWILELGDDANKLGEDAAAATRDKWYRIRLLGGTSIGRRLLSHNVQGLLELCKRDDGSGRQHWRLTESSRGGLAIEPWLGDGLAKLDCLRLGATTCGKVGLHVRDDEMVQQRWLVPGFSNSGDAESLKQSSAKTPSLQDDVVAIVSRSGVESASSLRNLTVEQMTRVLGQNRNLGVALDLVGAYLKNYEIDKADRLCRRIEPLCRERGGVWVFKLLNFYSTVRMKQSRYEEALKMYKEFETLISFSPEAAWELYDTVYRNFGWIYTSLHDYATALAYFEKAVEVKRAAGVQTHWFDQWDLGKTIARLSLERGEFRNLEPAFKLITEATSMHLKAEPDDTIMRCKMMNSAGECAAVLGEYGDFSLEVQRLWYEDAIDLHKGALDLYMEVLGPSKPLTGWCMEDLAKAYQKCGRFEEAKPLLHGALRVECAKDIIKLPSMARLLDDILDIHQRTDDLEGLAECQDAINRGLENLQRRRIDESEHTSFAALLQKVATMLLAHNDENRETATALLEEALARVRQHSGACAKIAPRPKERPEKAEEERQPFDIPRAGNQELDEIDAVSVTRSLELQLSTLRQENALNLSKPISFPSAVVGSPGIITGDAFADKVVVGEVDRLVGSHDDPGVGAAGVFVGKCDDGGVVGAPCAIGVATDRISVAVRDEDGLRGSMASREMQDCAEASTPLVSTSTPLPLHFEYVYDLDDREEEYETGCGFATATTRRGGSATEQSQVNGVRRLATETWTTNQGTNGAYDYYEAVD